MRTYWSDQISKYDGSQLRSLFAYMTFGIQGDSIIAWRGPCNVPFAHMVDGEDARARSEIRGADMLHFIVEIFQNNLFSAVALQRILASHAQIIINSQSPKPSLVRNGDDLYLGEKKLSISVATQSPVSSLIHFAVNINNDDTPVATLSLTDIGIAPEVFANELMSRFAEEFASIQAATCKVFGVR